MGIVAPVSGVVAALVPIVVAAFTAGLPGPLQLAGFALAMASVWLLTAHEDGRPRPRELVIPVASGLGFGFFYVFLDQANDHSIYLSLVVQRCVAALVVLAAALIARQSLLPARGALWLIAIVGVFDVGGNVFFSLAALAGRLDVAGVLASLYPGATVAWASLLLRERLSRPQWAGVAAALAAIAFIAL
jgi:drug/metabolite transporter (DMT)-like permease